MARSPNWPFTATHSSEIQFFVAMRKNILGVLGRGDRRSIGQANQLAALAAQRLEIFGQLIEALWDPEPVVRMRAADAAEKASAQRPELLEPFKAAILGLLVEARQQELRWDLAQMASRLDLTHEERHRAAAALRLYLGDRSSIVRTFAMQALADLAEQDASLQTEVVELIRRLARTGSPAMRARGRKLLMRLERP
jgi:hypothetical protein